MFGIGFLEICIVMVFSLILFGPQKAPEFMQTIGRFLFQMRKVSNEVKSSVEDVISYEEKTQANTHQENTPQNLRERKELEKSGSVSWSSKD